MSDPQKEKLTKEIVVMIQPSLYEQFKDKCSENYVSVSEVVRQFIREYIREDKRNTCILTNSGYNQQHNKKSY